MLSPFYCSTATLFDCNPITQPDVSNRESARQSCNAAYLQAGCDAASKSVNSPFAMWQHPSFFSSFTKISVADNIVGTTRTSKMTAEEYTPLYHPHRHADQSSDTIDVQNPAPDVASVAEADSANHDPMYHCFHDDIRANSLLECGTEPSLMQSSSNPSHILNTSDYHLAQQRTPHRSEESSDHPVVPNEPQEKETDVKRRPSWISTYYRNWWFWELAGALLSAACIMAVVVLAYKINNSSLAAWKLPISPSTMISTFITIAKTSMLLPIAEGLSQLKWLYYWTTRSKYRPLDEIEAFDDASRGPWGSLLIFFCIGFRKGSFLALLGALITVATLAMGPFAQQIVSLESRSVPQPNVNSTIPIARIYDTGAISSDDYVYNRKSTCIPRRMRLIPCAPAINADSDMQGAFFNGLFNLGTPFDFTCPTGNCTWPEFSSLALCSNCEDVTGQTAREEIGGENKSAPTTLLKTPGGVSIQLNDRGSSKGYYDLLAGNTSGLYTWSTLLLATIAVAQAQGEAIGFSFEPQYDEYVRDSLSYTVTECNITWCAKRYRDVSVVCVVPGLLVQYILNSDISAHRSTALWRTSRWKTSR